MSVTIKTTFNLPSKKSLWLVEVTGVNYRKFSGKNGELLKKYTDSGCRTYDDTFWRVLHASKKRKFLIASVDEVENKQANFTYRKIKKFNLSSEDISYQFTFGFGNEIYAKTMEELQKEIQEKFNHCKKHIEKAKKSKEAIKQLLNEFKQIKGEEDTCQNLEDYNE